MDEEWLSSRHTIDLARKVISIYQAPLTICARANDGLIATRARRFFVGERSEDNFLIPEKFWWGRGDAVLKQNWNTGDFETWINRELHCRAYGVDFRKADILAFLPAGALPQEVVAKAGRPPADWWDDMWVAICRQLYLGDLKPRRQAEIETAMMDWIAASGNSAAGSTVRPRARKLWRAISSEDGN